jgi:hypothetical protein
MKADSQVATVRGDIQEKNVSTNQLRTYSLALVALVAVFFWDWHLGQSKIAAANSEIVTYTEWLRRTDNSIRNMLLQNKLTRIAHQFAHKSDTTQIQKQRWSMRTEMEIAFSEAETLLGKDIGSTGTLLSDFDKSVKDIFAANAPPDSAWELFAIRNKLLFNLKIKQQQQEIKRAETFILLRLWGDIRSLLNWI